MSNSLVLVGCSEPRDLMLSRIVLQIYTKELFLRGSGMAVTTSRCRTGHYERLINPMEKMNEVKRTAENLARPPSQK